MRAPATIAIAAAVMVAGCRAVLGIEDLDLQKDGGANTDGGGGGDAKLDALALPDVDAGT